MLKNESTEMYLETILRLSERSKAIREVDLADAMKVSKVSVCKAVKRLVTKCEQCHQRVRIEIENGIVHVAPYSSPLNKK